MIQSLRGNALFIDFKGLQNIAIIVLCPVLVLLIVLESLIVHAEKTSVNFNTGHEKFGADQVREFRAGDWIAHEGDESREMYIIVSGTVEISKNSQRGPVVLATVERGGFVGEMSLLESLPRSASLKALTDVKVLAIQPGGFLVKIRRDPTFAFEIMQSLSRRIRRTNEALLGAIESGTTSAAAIQAIVNAEEVPTK